MTSSLIATAFSILSAVIAAQTGTERHLFTEWAAIKAPLPGTPAAIGFVTAHTVPRIPSVWKNM